MAREHPPLRYPARNVTEFVASANGSLPECAAADPAAIFAMLRIGTGCYGGVEGAHAAMRRTIRSVARCLQHYMFIPIYTFIHMKQTILTSKNDKYVLFFMLKWSK